MSGCGQLKGMSPGDRLSDEYDRRLCVLTGFHPEFTCILPFTVNSTVCVGCRDSTQCIWHCYVMRFNGRDSQAPAKIDQQGD